jgi:hypothetical protein
MSSDPNTKIIDSSRTPPIGRVVEGLDPEHATIEQIQLATNFLFAAVHGHGAVLQGSHIHIGGHRLALRQMNMRVHVSQIPGGDYHVTSLPPHESKQTPGDLVSVGIFMGMLHHVSPKKSSLGIYGALEDGQSEHFIWFHSKRNLVLVLNKFAREWPKVFPVQNPSQSKPAIEWLSEIARMHPAPIIEQ